jgi:hypothetical protein
MAQAPPLWASCWSPGPSKGARTLKSDPKTKNQIKKFNTQEKEQHLINAKALGTILANREGSLRRWFLYFLITRITRPFGLLLGITYPSNLNRELKRMGMSYSIIAPSVASSIPYPTGDSQHHHSPVPLLFLVRCPEFALQLSQL